MVTGAGGSIGSELCRQIVKINPTQLLLFEQNEASLYQVHKQLLGLSPTVTIIQLLGSLQDENRLKEIISTWRPETIYHAAAYKHVPLVGKMYLKGLEQCFGT